MNPEEENQIEESGGDIVGCLSLGSAFVFLAVGVAWPVLHVLGRTYEPEILFVSFFVGGPALIIALVLALISLVKQPRGKSLGAWTLIVLVAAVVVVVVISILAGVIEARNSEQEASPPPGFSDFDWYWQWIKKDIEDGASFHSEFALRAGEVRTMNLASEGDLKIGAAVKHGYEITKAEGTIYLGTEEQPHRAGGSPEFSVKFSPENGVIRLRIENTTAVDTRIALHTTPGG